MRGETAGALASDRIIERCVRMARKNTLDQDQVGALRQQVDSLTQQSAALAGDAGRKASEAAATGARMAQEQTEALAVSCAASLWSPCWSASGSVISSAASSARSAGGKRRRKTIAVMNPELLPIVVPVQCAASPRSQLRTQ